MKRILAIMLLLLASALGARAQLGNVYLKHFTSDPTGLSCGKNQMAVNDSTLLLYGCQNGVFALYTVGGFPAGTFSTNGAANTSQSGVNFLTSTTNTSGFTITPSNPATNQMKFELTGVCNATAGCSGLSDPTAHALLVPEGSAQFNVACAGLATNGDYAAIFHVTASVTVDPTCPQIGVLPRVVSGATATDVPTFADATCVPIVHDKAGSAGLTVTVPTPTTLANANACLIFENHSANTDTLKATTWTIQSGTSAAVAGATGITVPPGRKVILTVDPFNATNWLAASVSLLTATDGLTATTITTIGTTAGFVDFPQGSTSAAVAPCNTATSICEQAPAAVTSYLITKPGAAATGTPHWVNSSNVVTESVTPVATLTSDWTCGTGGTVSSCTTAQTIGALTITLPLIATNWTLDCNLIVGQATAATANNWAIQTATNGATNTEIGYMMNTAATAMTGGALTGQASGTTYVTVAPTWTLGAAATKMPVHIWGTFEGVSASGTVINLGLIAPTVADLVTIYRGSSCRVF